eukprot:TRINITY_DN14149_c0_g1_i1.p1 TRINITY_DN14149_c0_g1~~TRINITY_DN14149_c0_g1_i1.p1  ORF type:complete len:698 (+),score=148.80 TRINITY_DN14149_c0_g1_i1:42-2096(+)
MGTEDLSVSKLGVCLRNAVQKQWHQNKKLRNAIRKLCIAVGERMSEDDVQTLLQKNVITVSLMAWEGGVGEGMFLLSNVVFFAEGAAAFEEDFLADFCEQLTTQTFQSNPSVSKVISSLITSSSHESRVNTLLQHQILEKLINSLPARFPEIGEAILQICTHYSYSIPIVVSSLLHYSDSLQAVVESAVESQPFSSLLQLLIMSGKLSPLSILLADINGTLTQTICKLSKEQDTPLFAKYCMLLWNSESMALLVKNAPEDVRCQCSPALLNVAGVSSSMRNVLLDLCTTGDDDEEEEEEEDGSSPAEATMMTYLINNQKEAVSRFCNAFDRLGGSKKRPRTDRTLAETFIDTLTHLSEQECSSTQVPNCNFSYRCESAYALSSAVDSDAVKMYEKSTKEFGPITVTRHFDWMCLRFGDVEQGLSYVGNPSHEDYNNGKSIPHVLGYDYIRGMAAASLAYIPLKTKKVEVLCVGLGSGALPIYVHSALRQHLSSKTSLVTKTFEIEEQVVHAVETTMTGRVFNNDDLVVEICDALEGIKRHKSESTNCVLIDAYNAIGGIPSHLRTKDFLSQVERVLCKDGVAVMNLHNGPIGSNDRNQSVEYLCRLREYFPSILLIKLPTQQSNLVAVALKSETPPPLRNTLKSSPKVLDGSEFQISDQIQDQKVFGLKPTDPDGMPQGWWGNK